MNPIRTIGRLARMLTGPAAALTAAVAVAPATFAATRPCPPPGPGPWPTPSTASPATSRAGRSPRSQRGPQWWVPSWACF